MIYLSGTKKLHKTDKGPIIQQFKFLWISTEKKLINIKFLVKSIKFLVKLIF